MDEETVTKLNENIDRLNQNIERQTSLRYLIIRGLVYGISIVIGTTILAGIVISILNRTFGPLEDIPILRDLVDKIPSSSVEIE